MARSILKAFFASGIFFLFMGQAVASSEETTKLQAKLQGLRTKATQLQKDINAEDRSRAALGAEVNQLTNYLDHSLAEARQREHERFEVFRTERESALASLRETKNSLDRQIAEQDGRIQDARRRLEGLDRESSALQQQSRDARADAFDLASAAKSPISNVEVVEPLRRFVWVFDLTAASDSNGPHPQLQDEDANDEDSPRLGLFARLGKIEQAKVVGLISNSVAQIARERQCYPMLNQEVQSDGNQVRLTLTWWPLDRN